MRFDAASANGIHLAQTVVVMRLKPHLEEHFLMKREFDCAKGFTEI